MPLLLRLLKSWPGAHLAPLERWLRGRQEAQQIRRAGAVVVSYPKSGRTWLRALLAHTYEKLYDLPQVGLLQDDNLHQIDGRVPSVVFTHHNYLPRFTGRRRAKKPYRDRPVILLVRDPRDVVASHFFHWKFRMSPHKQRLNAFPPQDADLDPFDFATSPHHGVPAVVRFLNDWAGDLDVLNVHLLRYEDLHRDPEGTLLQLFGALRTPTTPSLRRCVRQAVDFAAFDNLRQLEAEGAMAAFGSRLRTADALNPNAFKVRRGRVGGYRDDFSSEQINTLNALMKPLHPVFGYGDTQP